MTFFGCHLDPSSSAGLPLALVSESISGLVMLKTSGESWAEVLNCLELTSGTEGQTIVMKEAGAVHLGCCNQDVEGLASNSTHGEKRISCAQGQDNCS